MPRLPSYAVPLVAVVALAAGCSSPAEPPEQPQDARAEGFRAPELGDDGDDAGTGTGSGAPSFSGRLPLDLSEAEREVVDDPCTANVIERLCGSSANAVIRAVGDPTPVTLTGATTRTEAGGSTWRVRLGFAEDDAPLPRTPAGGVQVLEGRDDLQVEVGATARVTARAIVLTGLDKRSAWSLVERVSRG